MGTRLRCLLVEDSESDAGLIVRGLQQAGYEVVHERVETASQMRAALEERVWDAVIADYTLPEFSGPAALALLQQTGLDLPFFVVSGTIGEKAAVAMIKAGAHDYLMKDDLARLGPAIERELGDRQARRSKVLGFLGVKGGVGATTLAVNVAALLVQQKRKVIVAESAPYGGSIAPLLHQTPPVHLGGLLGLEPACIDRQQLNAHLVAAPSGFRVLYAPQTLNGNGGFRRAPMETILTLLPTLADFTLLDMDHRNLSYLQAAIPVCTFLALVVEPEPIALQSVKTILGLAESCGAQEALTGIVVVNRTGLSSGMMLPEIRAKLGRRIVGVVPPAADLCAQAHKAGNLPVLARPESTVAAAFSDIAKRLMEEPVGALYL